MKLTLMLLGAYLLGSISPAYHLCRALHGDDLRTLDSGNLGARNIGRVVGTWAGITVLLIDGAKGYAAVAAARALGAEPWLAVACGAACVAGHNWPVYLGLRGGRGAATTAGASLAVVPVGMSVGLVVCLIILRTARSLYIGGIAAIAIATALSHLLGDRGVVAWSQVLIALPMFARHLPDIVNHVRERDRRIP